MALGKERLKSNIFNIPGWHTKRKIVVFESDDWGSIRIPSKEVYNYLTRQGYPISETPYGNDCLESNNDVDALLEVLSSVSNREGQHPVFTLNCIMANPDFAKIRKVNFDTYYFESFVETYRKYPDHNRSFELMTEGVRAHLFRPQLHGREHLNVDRWLKALKLGKQETIDLFAQSMYGLSQHLSKDHKRTLQSAFDYESVDQKGSACGVISDAIGLFKTIWGFHPLSFIAPNYFWDDYIENCLAEKGIKYIQGQRGQVRPAINGNLRFRYHFTGQKNRFGQTYLVRNCYFEPSLDPSNDFVNSCLAEMANAFRWRKPAVISSHRVNYIGSINQANRDKGIKGLVSLLAQIITKWPEAEFLASDQLGNLINDNTTT